MTAAQDNEILNIFKDVISTEASALQALVGKLDLSFVKATRLVLNAPGKVITTGVGKSGFVAKKIAATLSSTGTLAIFLHPTEATHGDLGVVNKGDVVIAFSKSGESVEINNLLEPLKAIGAQIIGVTAVPESTLAKASHIHLYAGVAKEACPLDLAPTASVVAALAVGDALAISLMKLKNFKEQDFAQIHPGGQIGRKFHLKVKDRMVAISRCLPLNSKTATLDDVLATLGKTLLGVVLFFDDQDQFVAIITDGDVRRALSRHKARVFEMKLADFWNEKPTSVPSDMNVGEAVSFMENREKPFNVVVVREQDRVVGVARLHDLLG